MTDTKTLIEKFGIRANKSLGQNFLHRTDLLEEIADAAAGTPNVLEIGAGLGVLTSLLCQRFEKAVTVEIDRSLKEVTEYSLKDVSNHTMVYGDFLKVKPDTLTQYFTDGGITVCGNLPYNITGNIITKLLKNRTMFEKAVIMIQKEAAQKLCATPSDKNYRAISVLTGYFCECTPLFDVSPDCFIPQPHVTSTVVELKFRKELMTSSENERGFFEFVNRVFSQRRKKLVSIFQSPDARQKALKTLEKLGYCENTRGEELLPNELCALYLETLCK